MIWYQATRPGPRMKYFDSSAISSLKFIIIIPFIAIIGAGRSRSTITRSIGTTPSLHTTSGISTTTLNLTPRTPRNYSNVLSVETR